MKPRLYATMIFHSAIDFEVLIKSVFTHVKMTSLISTLTSTLMSRSRIIHYPFTTIAIYTCSLNLLMSYLKYFKAPSQTPFAQCPLSIQSSYAAFLKAFNLSELSAS